MAKLKTKATKREAKGKGSVYQRADGLYVAQVYTGTDDQGKRTKKSFLRKTQTEAVDAFNDYTIEHVYQTRTGWTAFYDENNKSTPALHKEFEAKTREEAIKARDIFKAQRTLGIDPTPETQSVGDYLDTWLRDTIEPHQEPKTYRVYEQIVRLYLKPKLGHLPLAKVNSQHVQAALNQLSKSGARPAADGTPRGLSPKTVRDIKGVLCSALTTAKVARLIDANPAEDVKTPKLHKPEATYLTEHEAITLIDHSRTHYLGPLIEIALMTGMRLGEATGLTWDNVDFTLGVIRVRQQLQRVKGVDVLKDLKTRASKRTLALPDEALATLQEQRERQKLMAATLPEGEKFNPMNLVFTSIHARPLEAGQVDDALKALCIAAEIRPVSFHKLRHTAATHMAAAGVPLSIVKDQLGHSTLAMTSDTYAHAVPAAMKQASDALGNMFRSAKKKQ